uniref:SFRICE_020300 n=1 Tax=Spodoptera frugiperda TaxID=7108 RepID=A0A2H1VCV9_SPOFR
MSNIFGGPTNGTDFAYFLCKIYLFKYVSIKKADKVIGGGLAVDVLWLIDDDNDEAEGLIIMSSVRRRCDVAQFFFCGKPGTTFHIAATPQKAGGDKVTYETIPIPPSYL